MEYIRILTLLVWASLCAGQVVVKEKDVRLIGNHKRIEKQGVPMTLKCQVDKGLDLILFYSVSWFHLSLADPESPKETLLTTAQALMDAASPVDYGIVVDYNMTHCQFDLTVKRIRPQDDGVFICRMTQNAGNSKFEVKAYVIVPNDVEGVSLQFDGEDSMVGRVSEVKQLEEGHYGVTCFAWGFNPYATLSISVGDEVVPTEPTQVDSHLDGSLTAGARRYMARATAPEIFLKGMHSGSRIKCLAKADFEGARPMMASVPLSVIVVEPEIKCSENNSWWVGDRYVEISCMVHHENVHIDRYSWEISSTGEILGPDDPSNYNNDVYTKKIDEHTTEVTLVLYEAKKEHFDSALYLDVFTHSGQKFRMKAELIRLVDLNPSGSSTVCAAVVLCWLAALLAASPSFFNGL